MGDYAEDLINGDADQYTGEWIGGGQGFPRSIGDGRSNRTRTVEPRDPSRFAKSTRAIRKELAILIVEKQKNCADEKANNKAVGEARKEINLKYGKGWREQVPH
jgi:hypothetical protein